MKLSNAVLLMFAGAAVGAIAALLMAPDEGAITRKKLMKKAKKYKKILEDTAAEYKDKATKIKDDITGAASQIKKDFTS